jgi:hypothetical protein
MLQGSSSDCKVEDYTLANSSKRKITTETSNGQNSNPDSRGSASDLGVRAWPKLMKKSSINISVGDILTDYLTILENKRDKRTASPESAKVSTDSSSKGIEKAALVKHSASSGGNVRDINPPMFSNGSTSDIQVGLLYGSANNNPNPNPNPNPYANPYPHPYPNPKIGKDVPAVQPALGVLPISSSNRPLELKTSAIKRSPTMESEREKRMNCGTRAPKSRHGLIEQGQTRGSCFGQVFGMEESSHV